MIQPNAQVCHRLAGASLECRPSPFRPCPPSVGQSGLVPPCRSSGVLPTPAPLRVQNPQRAPFMVPRLHHPPPPPSPITARKRKCERMGGRACLTFGMRVCVRVKCMYAPRRRYVTSSHGNQCSWPPTRSHGAKPTRPASFGHLCANAPLTCPSLFLFFLIFLPLLLRASVSLPSSRSPSPLSFLFLRSFVPPAPLYFLYSMKITLCPRAIFQYLRKSRRCTWK